MKFTSMWLALCCVLTCSTQLTAEDSCSTDFDCDDRVFCNGEETCSDGSCVEGSPPCAEDELCLENFHLCIFDASENKVTDKDQDRVADKIDNCLSAQNDNQLDSDGDGIGNPCDWDDDDDGIRDDIDDCQRTPIGAPIDEFGCAIYPEDELSFVDTSSVLVKLESEIVETEPSIVIRYTVSATNFGIGTARGVSLKIAVDDVQSDLIFASKGGLIIDEELIWPLFDLAPGASTTRNYALYLEADQNDDNQIINLVDLGSDDPDPFNSNDPAKPDDQVDPPQQEPNDEPSVSVCGAGIGAATLTSFLLLGTARRRRRHSLTD